MFLFCLFLACPVPEILVYQTKKSKAWEYFTDLKHKRSLAQCNCCGKIISYKGGGPYNLIRHTKSQHPHVFFGPRKTKEPSASAAVGFQSDLSKLPTNPTNQVVSAQPSIPPSPEVVHPEVVPETRDQPKKRKFLTSEKTEAINKKLVKLFAKHYLPFYLVESTEFKEFVEELNTSYELPSENALSDVLVDKYYKTTKDTVKAELEKSDHIALSTDGWYLNKNELYLDVTAYFVNQDAILKAYTLECSQCDNYNTAENLAEQLRKICDDWEITNKVVTVSSNNVFNIRAAVQLNLWRHVTCFGHSLNLAIQNALGEIKPIHQKVKQVVEFYQRNHIARIRLKQMQETLGETSLNLKQDDDTLWHTTCLMFDRVLEMRHSIMAENYPYNTKLTNSDLEVLRGVTEILGCFKDVIEEMSSRIVMISEMFYVAYALKNTCSEYLRNEALPELVRSFVRRIIVELDGQFSNLEEDPSILKSTLLDPRFKKHGFHNNDVCETACRYVRISAEKVQMPESASTEDVVVPPPSKKRSIWQSLDSKVSEILKKSSLSSKVQREMENYLEEPPLPRTQNPLKWWFGKKYQYPRLYAVAYPLLCVPATSVPPEQIFLKSGKMKTEWRNRLSGKSVEKMVFLNKNL